MVRFFKACLIVILGSMIFVGCNPTITISQGTKTEEPMTANWRCDQVPDTFQDTDLIGIWQTRFGTSRTDTLNLSENGYYIHTFSNESTGYHYKSEPQEWWVERRDSDGTYVHFERMLYCGGVSGCIDPQEKPGYYDYCSDHWFEMDGEFILAVIGDPSVPRGIWLRHMRPAGNETFFAEYILMDK